MREVRGSNPAFAESHRFIFQAGSHRSTFTKPGKINFCEEMKSGVKYREIEKLEDEEIESEVRFHPLTS